MHVRILGNLEVIEDGQQIVLPRGLARSLLCLLTLHAGQVVSADRLIDQLWGQAPPPTAAKALHGLVSTLRKRLEHEADMPVLETRPPGYRLAIDRDQVDANLFRRLVSQAAEAPAPAKAILLREALDLWRGPALAEFAYEPFAQAAIAELEEMRLAALEARSEAELALGHHAQLVPELEGLVAQHALREGLRAQLIVALYRCGRQADALDLYRATRELLDAELGVEPGPALQHLERAILTHDPALMPPDAGHIAQIAEQPGDRRWLVTGRRIVTVMFADLSESAADAAAATADPEVVRSVVRNAYHGAVDVLGRYGATVEGLIGDVIVAVFGVPIAHEDDAARGVRAAHALREHLAAVNIQARQVYGIRLTARIGVSTGEVVIGDPSLAGSSTTGPPVALAARLQQAAANGEVLLAEPTRRLIGDTVLVEPVTGTGADGLGAVTAWRLIDVPDSPARAADDTTLVGRQAELSQLHRAYDLSVRRGQATLVTIVGEPGIGKSRLAAEFAAQVESVARVAAGNCPAFGEGITFWPLREILRELAASSHVHDLIDRPTDPAEMFGAVRRLFESIARQQPLVLIFEDVHWAQPTLLDLIEHLATAAQPLVLLCLARPEFVQARTNWGQDLATATIVNLEPLDRDTSQRLLTSRLFGRTLPAAALTRVVDAAQGNPLFLEQLLAALRDDFELQIPPTVQALLTARLDRLGPAEQDVLRCASVIGTEFSAAAVAALVAAPAVPFAERHLDALRLKEFVTHTANLTGPARYWFRHVLIQTVAYASLTHQDRSQLHERYANWLAHKAGQTEVTELISLHLEQAYLHRRAAGLLDATSDTLALRAGESLAGAGQLAYRRFDVPAAANLLSRAESLLPQGHHLRPAVLQTLSEAYPILGQPEQAEGTFAKLLALADGEDYDSRAILLERNRFRLITGPDPIHLETIRHESEAALEYFRAQGNEVRISQALYVLCSVHLRAGRVHDLEETARQGLLHARRSGNLREQLGAPWWIVLALRAGRRPVPDCLAACEEIVDTAGIKHIAVLSAMGHFHAMLGDFTRARELIAQAHQVLSERVRVPRPRIFIGRCQAGIEILAGNRDAAERALRAALEVALTVAERDEAAQIAAELSLELSRRNAGDEAIQMATLAAAQAPAESVSAQALATAARGQILVAAGDYHEAERHARQAVELVPADMLSLRATLLTGLAEILRSSKRHDESETIAAEAIRLYERKGNVVAAKSTADQCRRSR